MKKFCCCLSLRTGALSIAYSGITVDVFESIWNIISKDQFCGDILVIWIISAFWNILSDMVLFIAIYRENPHLLPVHLVTCLAGLMLEMVSHMVIAAIGMADYYLVGFAFFKIGYTTADLVIVLSYYHSEV
ncbi:uncharacterized protein LOC108028998 [Drosophila biarmipes]|uniref:uncharacterized protein LOC108028998 n=1 Tax=Drosophila biarmipes TaxID=125945 RepID=UPI0007E8517F|nr:uncharacterized protein LOC108028998 [Drosophila biarmipes]XP_016956531.1 uncharacterized protein LOC108028998 [Drosophila biarmipes]